jgi:hypothetical protein
MNRDLEFGKEKEKDFLQVLRDRYGDDVIQIDNQYSPFDFISPTHLIELKARRNNKNKYPSVMVGYNKILSAQVQERKVVFCFDFLDNKCYYEYKDEDKDKIEIRLGGRTDRNKNEIKMYAYIPLELLSDF